MNDTGYLPSMWRCVTCQTTHATGPCPVCLTPDGAELWRIEVHAVVADRLGIKESDFLRALAMARQAGADRFVSVLAETLHMPKHQVTEAFHAVIWAALTDHLVLPLEGGRLMPLRVFCKLASAL